MKVPEKYVKSSCCLSYQDPSNTVCVRCGRPFVDVEKLPEWYQMAREFFMEIRAYSTSMYEDMHGDSILNQMRFAAEREYRLTLDNTNE